MKSKLLFGFIVFFYRAIEIIDLILNDPGKNFSNNFLMKIMEAFYKHGKHDEMDSIMMRYS